MNWMFFIASLTLGSFVCLPQAVGNGERKLGPVDPIATQVGRLQPKMQSPARHRLAAALRDVSRECGMPWQILLSVAFHESSLKTGAVNAKTRDYGLTQINDKTILNLRLDRSRLLTDERYALGAACRVLSENRTKHASTFRYWLGMYRSGNAVWKDAVRRNAMSYDTMIRKTAAQMGYRELRFARK